MLHGECGGDAAKYERRKGITQYHLSSPERRRTYPRTNGW